MFKVGDKVIAVADHEKLVAGQAYTVTREPDRFELVEVEAAGAYFAKRFEPYDVPAGTLVTWSERGKREAHEWSCNVDLRRAETLKVVRTEDQFFLAGSITPLPSVIVEGPTNWGRGSNHVKREWLKVVKLPDAVTSAAPSAPAGKFKIGDRVRNHNACSRGGASDSPDCKCAIRKIVATPTVDGKTRYVLGDAPSGEGNWEGIWFEKVEAAEKPLFSVGDFVTTSAPGYDDARLYEVEHIADGRARLKGDAPGVTVALSTLTKADKPKFLPGDIVKKSGTRGFLKVVKAWRDGSFTLNYGTACRDELSAATLDDIKAFFYKGRRVALRNYSDTTYTVDYASATNGVSVWFTTGGKAEPENLVPAPVAIRAGDVVTLTEGGFSGQVFEVEKVDVANELASLKGLGGSYNVNFLDKVPRPNVMRGDLVMGSRARSGIYKVKEVFSKPDASGNYFTVEYDEEPGNRYGFAIGETVTPVVVAKTYPIGMTVKSRNFGLHYTVEVHDGFMVKASGVWFDAWALKPGEMPVVKQPERNINLVSFGLAGSYIVKKEEAVSATPKTSETKPEIKPGDWVQRRSNGAGPYLALAREHAFLISLGGSYSPANKVDSWLVQHEAEDEKITYLHIPVVDIEPVPPEAVEAPQIAVSSEKAITVETDTGKKSNNLLPILLFMSVWCAANCVGFMKFWHWWNQ